MRMTKLLVLFILITQILFVPTVKAYEGTLHYAWTYYLALQVGYTERQAYQIASGTNAIDWDEQTNPVASPLDVKIDTLFGAERFRYFDRELHEQWEKLYDKFTGSGLNVKDLNANFRSLRNMQAENQADTMLDGAWKNYYDALVLRNPAVRTWVQLHAFQPIVLQKHRNPALNERIDFTLNKNEQNFIALNSQLTNYQLKEVEWEDTWAEYLFPDRSLTTQAASFGLDKPIFDKNSPFSQKDAETFDLFKTTISVCGKNSIKDCLCESINDEIRDLNNEAELLNKEAIKTGEVPKKNQELKLFKSNQYSLLELTPLPMIETFNCKEKISISAMQTKKKELFVRRDVMAMVGVNKSDVSIRDKMKKLELMEDHFLTKIRKYQTKTMMSWPLIYSSLIRDIDTYVLNEYWNPSEPTDLQESHIPTKAVNAVRGNVTKQLWALARYDGNPGPLLHYIQDIHSHGPYNTYNGHALTNHAPDFIDQQEARNALNATYDTLVILCTFKKELLKKRTNPTSNISNQFFTGQDTHEADFCESTEGILSFISEKSLSSDPATPKTLKDILIELGKQSNAPAMQQSKVTWALMEKMGFMPPHHMDGDKTIKTILWPNEKLGLPDFPGAVQYLSQQVKPDLIPVWRDRKLRIEKNLRLADSVVANTGKMKIRDEAIKNLPIWKWTPSEIPNYVIQYNYDYCGRVMDGHMDWPLRKDYVGPDTRVVSCDKISAYEIVLPEDTPEKNTKELFPVENISIAIRDMSIKRRYDKESGVYTGAWDTTLTYDISGVSPFLAGGRDVFLTKPKSIELGGGARAKTVLPEASTDMYTEPSNIQHGPNHLPVLEICQLLMVNADDIARDMNSIIKGTFHNGDKEKATERVYNYMFGQHEQSKLRNIAVLYKTKKLQDDELNEPSHDVSFINFPMEDALWQSAAIYMACSIQVQGLPPVLALKKASREVRVEIQFSPGKSL